MGTIITAPDDATRTQLLVLADSIELVSRAGDFARVDIANPPPPTGIGSSAGRNSRPHAERCTPDFNRKRRRLSMRPKRKSFLDLQTPGSAFPLITSRSKLLL